MSYHKSNLGSFAPSGVADVDGYIPEPDDDWRDMRYDLGPDDPDEPGITDAERAARVEYLDEEWWPSVIARAAEVTSAAEAGIDQWQHDGDWADAIDADPIPSWALRRALDDLGWTQKALADEVDASLRTVQAWLDDGPNGRNCTGSSAVAVRLIVQAELN